MLLSKREQRPLRRRNSTGSGSAPGDASEMAGINLLPCHIMALRNLRHCRIIDPDRHDDPELLFIAPPPPPLKSKNFTPHRHPRIRHVANDVVMHVS